MHDPCARPINQVGTPYDLRRVMSIIDLVAAYRFRLTTPPELAAAAGQRRAHQAVSGQLVSRAFDPDALVRLSISYRCDAA